MLLPIGGNPKAKPGVKMQSPTQKSTSKLKNTISKNAVKRRIEQRKMDQASPSGKGGLKKNIKMPRTVHQEGDAPAIARAYPLQQQPKGKTYKV